jgi:hypothetical protein
MDKAATHLLIGPDDAATVDSQKLQWVLRTNERRLKEQSEEPPIHVVWDSWLLHCAATGSRVSEAEFAYSEGGARPEPPDDIERVLRRGSAKKPAKVYVTASNVGASTGGKEALEKARIRKVAPAETVWNTILSARGQSARDEDGFVPPTQMQTVPTSSPPTSTPPMPVSDAPPPAIDVDDSATEDEDESVTEKKEAAPASRTERKSAPTPAPDAFASATTQRIGQPGGMKATSMVSRLNSLRDSAFQFGAGGTSDQNAPTSSSRTLARPASNLNPGQETGNPITTANGPGTMPAIPSATVKVFSGKRIAPLGEARGPMLYAALRTHGAIVVEGSEGPDLKGKGKAKDDDGEAALLQDDDVDYYIVRLAR